MRYFSSILLTIFFFSLLAGSANAELLNIKMKQGGIINWETKKLENVTAVELIKTKPVENWGKWNALVDGFSLDIFAAYDAEDIISSGGVLLGRKVGVLSQYLPFIGSTPLTDAIDITLYPIGIYISDIGGENEVSTCSGMGLIGFELKF